MRHFASRHFSKLRHFFAVHFAGISVEVEVVPPKKPDLAYYDLEYQITIRVARKGKVWTQSRYVSYFTGKSLEKVIAIFKTGTSILDRVALKAKLINTSIQQIFVKIK